MASRVYLDTSAYLAVLLGETNSSSIEKRLKGVELCSSILLVMEAERSLVRLSRQGFMNEKNWSRAMKQLRVDIESFLLRDLTLELCLTGAYPPVRTPSSSDLVHLRSALWFQNHGGLTEFITTDENQKLAAIDLGLPTHM